MCTSHAEERVFRCLKLGRWQNVGGCELPGHRFRLVVEGKSSGLKSFSALCRLAPRLLHVSGLRTWRGSILGVGGLELTDGGLARPAHPAHVRPIEIQAMC